MSYTYGNVDLATPEGAKGFDTYYSELRRAITGYERDATIRRRTPPAVVSTIHQRFLKADSRVEEIIGDEFPAADPEGAEAFVLFFMQNRERTSHYSRDMLGAIAIRDLSRAEPRYPAPVSRMIAGLALGNPQIVRLHDSKTMNEFRVVACSETPEPDLDIGMLSMLINAYNDGAFPTTSADSSVPKILL